MDVLPAVDILGGSVVRLMQGDYGAVTSYGDSPVAAATRWMEEGAELVHVVDLEGARDGMPNVDVWHALAGAGVRYQVGGGVRTADAATAAVEAGASRVILGTAAVWQPNVLADTVARLGADAVVASIDVKDGRATGAGWLDEGRAVAGVVAGAIGAGVRQFLVTAVARDGTMGGPDLSLVSDVIAQAGEGYVMCAGGIGSLDHIRQARLSGAGGVVVGRALYERAFTLEEARAAGAG